ncbi:glycerate kinase [Poriferisphaera sp. WC338]|uniref:glycerate kinase n=1 Tax=Poriferisphaera sp. WC338 TaxID=3425129 RepID=UPI003D8155D4
MKIICAPDSFKESISAEDAASAMRRGIHEVDNTIEVDCCPIGDGGEGTIEAIVAAVGGRFETLTVQGALGKPTYAKIGFSSDGRTAYIEAAEAIGLSKITPENRNPMQASTFGVGEMVKHAIDAQIKQLIICVGGSSTNDGGCGAAQALGVRFFNLQDEEIREPISGGMLKNISRVDITSLDPRLHQIDLAIACDVNNPLYGPSGAAHVYAAQKGASSDDIQTLDDGLKHLATLTNTDALLPGAGAAGGLAYGIVAMLGGQLKTGIHLVLEAVTFEDRIKNTDLILTGEGKLDSQTASGKAVAGIAEMAKKYNIPVHAIVGLLHADHATLTSLGVAGATAIGENHPIEYAMSHAAELIQDAAKNATQTSL